MFFSELTKSRAKERVRETDGFSADNHYVMNEADGDMRDALNGSIVRAGKKWHSAFSGTITHSSPALCPAYQMRLIAIDDDDIAPVCRTALVRCTMEISFCFFARPFTQTL